MESNLRRVLVAGATGFVGTRLHPLLVDEGFEVIGGTRHPDQARARMPHRTYVELDLEKPDSIERALRGVDATVYLVHGMTDADDYQTTEAAEATAFRDAAEKAGLQRVVYLGGIEPSGEISKHLASRLETGELLRSGTVPTVELRATMIVGGGSESFRIVRDLAARLPWMILPAWLKSRSEPVAVSDVAKAIVFALTMPLEKNSVFELPGPEVLTGKEILSRIATVLGHHPRMVEVPFVTPHLSSYWIRLVTRANPHLAAELVEGLRSDIVSSGQTLWERMPGHQRIGFDEAVRKALGEEERGLPLTTRWIEGVLHRFASAE